MRAQVWRFEAVLKRWQINDVFSLRAAEHYDIEGGMYGEVIVPASPTRCNSARLSLTGPEVVSPLWREIVAITLGRRNVVINPVTRY